MKILVTGSRGYIGSAASKLLSSGNDIVCHTREMFDLNDTQAVKDHFIQNQYDVVIHSAIKGGSRLKKDDTSVLYENLKCFYNLYDCKDSYKRLITFGSGAEFTQKDTAYGISKRCIGDIIKNEKKFINLRIYAVFDENELDTRFIKSSINNYLNRKDIVIHQNKYMDFFAMQDLLALIKYFCLAKDHEITNRVIDCCYERKYTLSDIAKYINALDNHRCNIVIQQPGLGENYTGFSNTLPTFEQIGLFAAINQMYNKLNDEQ